MAHQQLLHLPTSFTHPLSCAVCAVVDADEQRLLLPPAAGMPSLQLGSRTDADLAATAREVVPACVYVDEAEATRTYAAQENWLLRAVRLTR